MGRLVFGKSFDFTIDTGLLFYLLGEQVAVVDVNTIPNT